MLTARLETHLRLKRPPSVFLCDRNSDFQVKAGRYGTFTVARLTTGPWSGWWAATRFDGHYWYDGGGLIESDLPHVTANMPEYYGEFPGDLPVDTCDGWGVRIEPILFATRDLRTTFGKLLHRCPGVDHGVYSLIESPNVGEEVAIAG